MPRVRVSCKQNSSHMPAGSPFPPVAPATQVLRSLTQLQRLELHCDGQLFDFGSYRHEERWALPLERLRLAAAGRAAEGLQVVLHYGDLVDLVM